MEKLFYFRYIVRPSPFSAHKTFERHNSRRKSNISFCSNINLAGAGNSSSRRGSIIGGQNPNSKNPPLAATKANSLSLPDSPTVLGQKRGRSNSLRVKVKICFSRWIFRNETLVKSLFQIENEMLLRRSSSLRQGLPNIGCQGRRKSSLEEIGISHFTTLMQASNYSNSFKIALNGRIGLEVIWKFHVCRGFLWEFHKIKSF